MKKILGLLAVVMGMFAFTACSGGNTPSGVVADAYDAFIDKDYAEFVDYIHQQDGVTKQEREEFIQMLEEKGEMSIEQTGGLVSYEILSEEIAEDGQSALVKTKLTMGNGKTDDERVRLVKNADGEWKISMGK